MSFPHFINGSIWEDYHINAISQQVQTYGKAAEVISGGQPVYVRLDNGDVYVSDGGVQNDNRVNGIAISNVASGGDVQFMTRGVYDTTGLVPGSMYYLSGTTISTSFGNVRVGMAQSSSGLFVDVNQDDCDVVGTVKAWNKDFTGVNSTLSAFWQEMDGTTISDAESPLNGQTVPDLIGSAHLLVGSSTTNTEGSTEHDHRVELSGTGLVDVVKNTNGDSFEDGGTLNLDSEFRVSATVQTGTGFRHYPTYGVSWIMKVK